MEKSFTIIVGRFLSILAIASWTLESITTYGALAQVVSRSGYYTTSNSLTKERFVFEIPTTFISIVAAELYYSSWDASHFSGLRRSVNDLAPFGGYVDTRNGSENLIVEHLNPRNIVRGINTIQFLPGEINDLPEVYDVKLLITARTSSGDTQAKLIEPKNLFGLPFEKSTYTQSRFDDLRRLNYRTHNEPAEKAGPKIKILYPTDGSFFGSRALVRGQVIAPNGESPHRPLGSAIMRWLTAPANLKRSSIVRMGPVVRGRSTFAPNLEAAS